MLPARVFATLIAVILLAIAATTLITGDAVFLIPAVVLVALIAGYALIEKLLKMRLEARHEGDMAAAMADNEDPIPSAHLVPDDETPLGATSEAHDELSPHDLPKGHPSRAAIVDAVGENGTMRRPSREQKSSTR